LTKQDNVLITFHQEIRSRHRYYNNCSAANKAAANKTVKYGALSASHIFLPVAVETAGTWNQSAIELIQKIGRRITAVTEDTRENGDPVSALIYSTSKGECGRLPSYIRWRVIIVVVVVFA